LRLQTGTIVADRYVVETVIGSGGMSVVYRAHDKKLDRHVTLKVLKEDYLTNDDLADRFPQEARAAAALNHQNIVNIFDFGQDGDICYIVLEYVDGYSLKELIAKKAPFDDDIIIAVTLQIAEGLAEAHYNGIVHRDIKPQNILVTRTNIVKVADFGIARVARSSTLTAGGSMGSVHYSSPEQARNGYLDHTTDIYSLGVCMYEMATGTLPFDGEREVSIAMCHLNNEFPDILERNPNVSESIIQIIKKATEKPTALRYQTADDLINDLLRAQTDSTGSFVTNEVENPSQTRVVDTGKIARQLREAARGDFLDGIEHDEHQQPEEPALDNLNNYDDYHDPQEKVGKGPVFGGIIVGLLLIIPITLLALFIYGRLSNDRPTFIAPPDLINMSYENARERAEEYGLTIYVADWEYSNTVHYGYILSQVQTPRYRGLTAGDAVHVIVSLGEEEFEIPDLDPIYDENEYEGEPPTLEAGQVSVPILIGHIESTALERLTESMLIAGVRTAQESTTYAAGVIIMQDPMPGEIVYRETIVNYVVSTGPPAQMPTEQSPHVQDPPAETPPADDPPEETPPTDDPPEESPPEEGPPEEDPIAEDPPAEDPPVDDPPEEDPPVISTQVLTINLWSVPEGTESVNVRITRQDGNASPIVFANESNVVLDRFPISFEVSGTGSVTFHLYSIEESVPVPRGSETINFGG